MSEQTEINKSERGNKECNICVYMYARFSLLYKQSFIFVDCSVVVACTREVEMSSGFGR